MNTNLTIRSIFAAAVLGGAGTAYALSLGPVTGSAVVGRPFEVSAAIELDGPAQGSGSTCATAEVMYGERTVSSSGVSVDVTADGRLARISSATPVDEVFVTVLLHAGCGTQTTRRYVLLADAPQADSIVLEGTATLGAGASGPGPALASLRSGVNVAAGMLDRPGTKRNSYRAPARISADAETGRDWQRVAGRLQLANWEPGPEGSPWLRASTELLSMPAADAAHRAAATALWRALNAQPKDLLLTAERLRGLEGEVTSLRGMAARHRTEISSARESLLDTGTRHSTNLALVMALAMLAGGGAAVFWHRSRHAVALAPFASWYPAPEPRLDPTLLEEQSGAALPTLVETVLPELPRVEVETEPLVVPAAAVVTRRSAEPAPTLVPPIHLRPKAPVVSIEAPLVELAPPGVKVDALHDAQQQSEFFGSLGQFDEAIAVLTGYLAESADHSVLAYLELFRIYHGLERRGDYELLQTAFRATFGMDFAGFDDYPQEPRELELYLVPVSRIAVSWPSEASLEVIEKLLFKRPLSARELLSVDAYRELIWLYTLGRDILDGTRLPAGLQLVGGVDLPNDHFILPWALDEGQGPQELSLDRLDAIDVAPQLTGFAVDIDLTAAPGDARQQSRIDGRKASDKAWDEAAAPAPLATVSDSADAFDAVMEFHSRKNVG